MSRHILLGVAIVLESLLVLAPAAPAQVNPSDIRNVVANGDGSVQGWLLLDVPPGSAFVLTDLDWYGRFEDGDNQEVGLILRDPSQRWLALVEFNLPAGTAYQTLPIGGHWTTGLVFNGGSSVILDVNFPIIGRFWHVTVSGYLVTEVPSAAGEQSSPAVPRRLGQNAPNPFNPTTEIRYTLASPGEATLRFFDSRGRMVRTLVDGRKEAGDFAVIWDGRNDAGESLASGVYYYELATGAARETRKAVLLK